jgi:hypothetical protein
MLLPGWVKITFQKNKTVIYTDLAHACISNEKLVLFFSKSFIFDHNSHAYSHPCKSNEELVFNPPLL